MSKTRARPEARRSKIDSGAVLVAVLTLIAFVPALSGGLVWDDVDYVKNNPILRAPLGPAVKRMATEVVVGNYHPLTIASLALDNALFGRNLAGFHATSIALHVANAVLLGLVFISLGVRRDAAWAGALLWAVHPLRVESVAWISARKDALYVFFFLLALLTYLRHAKSDNGNRRAYGWSLALFACSALSKAASVAFVPLMFLVDWLVGRKATRKSMAEKIPFLAIAAVVGIIAVAGQRSAGAMPSGSEHGVLARLAFACYGLVFYAAKTLIPWRLSAFYPYPEAPTVAALSALVVAAAVVALVMTFRWGKAPSFAAGFYVATVALVLQVIPVGGAIAADRYAYLPGAAFSFLVASAISAVPFRRGIAAAVLIVALVLVGTTWARCAVWHDDATLWNDVLSKHPDVPLAHHNRGVDRAIAGDHRGAIDDFDAAIAESPRYADAYANRGASKADLGDKDGAIADLSEAIRIDPQRASYRFDLGLVLGDKGKWDEALASLGEAIRLKPDFAAAYLNRALALEQIGRATEGAADLRRAQELGYPVPPDIVRRFK